MASRLLEHIALRYFQMKGYQVDRSVSFPMPYSPVTKQFTGYGCIDMVAHRSGDLVIVCCEPCSAMTRDIAGISHLTAWFRHAVGFIINSPYASKVPSGGVRRVLVTETSPGHEATRELASKGIEVLLVDEAIGDIFRLIDLERQGYPPIEAPALAAENDVIVGFVRRLVAMGIQPAKR